MSLDGAGSITDWNPYIYDIAFCNTRRNAFGLSGGRQMGASGRMNMSEKMLEL